METEDFIDQVYQIAFGDNENKRDHSFEEVLEQLRNISDLALNEAGK